MIRILGTIGIIFMSVVFSFGQQQFEGIVEMRQETAAGMTYEVTWYIKKDKIAFEIKTISDNGSLKMRFVPQPQQDNMLMIINNSEKKEIASRDISGDIDLSNAEVSTNGSKESAEFGKVDLLVISTTEMSTEVEVVREIDVDLSKYAAFLKNDYGIQALIQSKQIGFPLNSVTKDKSGKVISQTKVKSVKKQKVSDDYFQ
jgi:hypothetical protein